MKKFKIKNLQIQILTGHKAVFKEGKYYSVNPFYKSTRENIKNNIEKAKEIYHDVFTFGFVPAWYILYKKPIPNYNELKELKI